MIAPRCGDLERAGRNAIFVQSRCVVLRDHGKLNTLQVRRAGWECLRLGGGDARSGPVLGATPTTHTYQRQENDRAIRHDTGRFTEPTGSLG